MPFNCPQCDLVSTTNSQFVKHLKTHPEMHNMLKRMIIDHSMKELQKPGQEGNREAAFRCLTGEVELVDFTLGERKKLLELCMTEECEQEGEQLLEELFYSWFFQCGEEPLALLQQLDVGSSRQELDSTGVRMSATAKVLRLMIRADPVRVEQFACLLDNTKVIPQEKLTPEKALYSSLHSSLPGKKTVFT